MYMVGKPATVPPLSIYVGNSFGFADATAEVCCVAVLTCPPAGSEVTIFTVFRFPAFLASYVITRMPPV